MVGLVLVGLAGWLAGWLVGSGGWLGCLAGLAGFAGLAGLAALAGLIESVFFDVQFPVRFVRGVPHVFFCASCPCSCCSVPSRLQFDFVSVLLASCSIWLSLSSCVH